MDINWKKTISWILVIILACIIFAFSNMDTNESNGKSKTTISSVIEKAVETSNGMGITNKHPSESKIQQVIEKLNVPLRKVAHASEYFILATLIIIALANTRIKGKKMFFIPILICFLYACTDEYHQKFISGRTSSFTDVLIDTLGAIIACLIIKIILKIKDPIQKNKKQIKI